MISPFSLAITTSKAETVIPAIVEYLKPKSFILSSVFDVSASLDCLNTSLILILNILFLNGSTNGAFLIISR